MADASNPGPVHLEIRDLHLSLGERQVFRGLSSVFPRGRISVVLGSSGSGKSTLLRAICGLARPSRGEIWVDGKTEVSALSGRELREHRRRIGMMFQQGALLDSWSVYDNVALPLREHTPAGEPEIRREVEAIFESVGLEDIDRLLPRQLSGGMLKRAALARALVQKPEILLCDEPFSGLDPATVRRVEALLVKVNQDLGITMVLTSHHIASTLRIADWVVLLVDGDSISGTPEQMQRLEDPRVWAFFSEQGPSAETAAREKWRPGFTAAGTQG